jgi:hypothetical protein
MEIRLRRTNLGYERPHIKLARYKMLKHRSGSSNPKRYELLNYANKRFSNDGLRNVYYKLIKINKYRMFTHLIIDVGKHNLSNALIDSSKSQSTALTSFFSTATSYFENSTIT